MSPTSNSKSISVRLEGGIGDHILGMRVLDFVRRRYPHHEIIAYSDASGGVDQLQVAAMSPLISRVVPIRRSEARSRADMGLLAYVNPDDLAMMMSADAFVDTYGEQLFAAASILLDVSPFEIMAQRPLLAVASDAQEYAHRLLASCDDDAAFVGINLGKHGLTLLQSHDALIKRFLKALLQLPQVVVLNIYSSSYDYAHWPKVYREKRRCLATGIAEYQESLCALSERIVPCVDLHLPTVAALLTRCRYFIGVDNGIKHLAWALGLKHTFLYPVKPAPLRAMRWMPDLNRLLLFDCREAALARHIAEALAAVAGTPEQVTPRD